MPSYKRNGKWYARWKINGKDYRKVTDATSKRQADRIAEQLRQDTEKQLAKAQTDVLYDVAMSEFLDQYCGVYHHNGQVCFRPAAVKPSTARRYFVSIRQLHDMFNGRFMLDIDPPVIAEYVEHRREGGTSDATILRDLTPLSRLFEFSRNKYPVLKYNPVKAFDKKYLKNSVDRIRFLTEDEINTVLHHAKQSMNVDLHDQILFALETGLRWNEQFSAKWEHFRLSNKGPELLIPRENSKGRTHRVVPLSSKAYGVIQRQQSKPTHIDGFIFWNTQTGNRVNSTRTSFETCLDRSKITDFVWHDLRHTFATQTLSKGMRIEFLSGILGHTKISTTQKYAHIMTSDLHDAMQAVAQ